MSTALSMILAPNLRLPLSGNKFLLLGLFLFCSLQSIADSLSDSASVGNKKDKLTLSFLLPLKLDELDTLNIPGHSERFTGNTMGLDFWQGAKMALDTLSAMGVPISANVIDVERKGFMMSSSSVLDRLSQSDLVIGPVFPEGFKSAALFSSTYKIPVVSPLSPSSLKIYQNPYFIGMYPTIEHHARADAAYMKKNFANEKIIVVQTGDVSETKLVTPFVAELQKLGKTAAVVKVPKSGADFSLLDKAFVPFKKRVMLMTSTNPTFITAFYNHLKEDTLAETAVFTHPNFDKTENLNIDLIQKMNTYTSSAYDIDYTDPRVVAFVHKYREQYASEPSETAIRAYGLVWYFGQVWKEENTEFFNKLEEHPMQLMFGKVRLERIENSGYHNAGVDILKYQDYDLMEQK